MHFIIGFAFVLLSGWVAAQQPVAESKPAQECYAPNVWAYCADEQGNALPPVCSNPEDSSPDASSPKPCTSGSSCSCDKPVTQPAAENLAPSRSYPPTQVIQWGEPRKLPTLEKNLKDLELKSSFVAPIYMAEYPEDVEMINQQSPFDKPEGFSVNTPSNVQNIIPPVRNIPESAKEKFNLNPEFIQNRLPPVQQQIPPSQTQDGLNTKYQHQDFSSD